MVMPRWLGTFLSTSLLLAAGFQAPQARAGSESYPERPVQMVIPFPAGGPADFVGRLYADALGRLTGQPVVVENPSGASGTIGTRSAARAQPDGYTLLYGTTSTMVINQIVMRDLPYDFDRDFSLIGLIANAPHVLAVRPGLPVQDLQELVELAKKEPGKLSYASAGVGTIIHMAGELFFQQAGIDVLHVPFKGGGPATLALLTGDVDMTINDLTTLKSHFESGKLRPLAVAHPSRLSVLPDTPTFAELGLPGMVSSTWWGLSVPAGTPEAVQQRLKDLHAQVIADPAFTARLAEMAIEPLELDPTESQRFIRSETEKWKAVADAADIRVN